MSQKVDLEIKVISNFVEKAKQDRYIQFVSSPKSRRKFIKALPHFGFFQQRLFEAVKGANEQSTILLALQKNMIPANTCYIISENTAIDTKILNIEEALGKTIGSGMGTILVFGNADMVYFEGEDVNTRFISRKVN